MTPVSPDSLKGAVKGDWKSIASLLLAALCVAIMGAWMITGYVLRGADSTIKSNTEKIITLESRQNLSEATLASVDRRQTEILSEVKAMSAKLTNVSESQARLEGIQIGAKK